MSERTRGRGPASESITSLRNKHDFGFLGRSRFDGRKEDASDGRGRRWKCTRDRTGRARARTLFAKSPLRRTALRVAAAINLMNDQASTHAWQGRRARDPTHSRE